MLKITQFSGFASGSGGGIDATPDAVNFNDVASTAAPATGTTNTVTISGIDTTVTLRLTLTTAMTGLRTVSVYRGGAFVSQGASGTAIDVSLVNGQTLRYSFTNSQDSTEWRGTATVSNLSDGGAILDTFSYYLFDTGSDPGDPVTVTF